MPDTFPHVANLQASERRFHPRQQVLYSHMLLDDDNGGVVLNISESGLAVSAVRSVTKDPVRMRFQLSESNVWIEARGRIAWTNASRQTAGVQFLTLPYEERILIRRWLASIDHLGGAAKKNLPVEEITPSIGSASAVVESASTASVSESVMPTRVTEEPAQDTAPKDLAGPSLMATDGVEIVSQYLGAGADTEGFAAIEDTEKPRFAASESADAVSAPQLEAAAPIVENSEQDLVAPDQAELLPIGEARDPGTGSAPEKTRPDTHPPLYLSYEEAPPIRAKVDLERTSSPRHSRLWTGVVLVALVLLAFALLGRYFRRAALNKRSVEFPATASQPGLPPSESVTQQNPPVSADLKQPLDQRGYVLQVGAMAHKENADALAEALRGKNFPAFVSHLEHDHFYFVFVGPYSDVDSALRAKTDLKKQGLESIRMPPRNP